MHIEYIHLQGYRNFFNALVHLRVSTLLIGSNDVGKTNLLQALRLLFDRNLSDAGLAPLGSDFHVIATEGRQVDSCKITVKISNIDRDSVIASMKGAISDDGTTFVQYQATKATLSYTIHCGSSLDLMELIPYRSYTRFISLQYVQSQRDLDSFIQYEKRNLLRLSKEIRTSEAVEEDEIRLNEIGTQLKEINADVRSLHYVRSATNAVNEELRQLSHHHKSYEVRLETGAIQTAQFIEKLELSGTTGELRIGLGGDGRNNQILMALWKAKSEREQDIKNEFVIYCIEEPEAHLHPHQQRKLAEYLVDKLNGQVLVTTHSPQITAKFQPESIVRLISNNGTSVAANDGCSNCVEEAWLKMGYRLSILPAEAFFSEMVLLVEGPSEVLLFHELARQLQIDLDRLNISILAVDGIDFNVYVCVLKAMGIKWAIRTDNDIFNIPKSNPIRRRLAGLNRARELLEISKYGDVDDRFTDKDQEEKWVETSILTNPKGVFISKNDLERDLVQLLPEECMLFTNTECQQEAVKAFKKRKAINMGHFLREHKTALTKLSGSELEKPLLFCLNETTKNDSTNHSD